MKIRKYVQSQSGAALILVLFVVLFISITGTVLLNATTYSMNTTVENEAVEGEFYRLEGALNLVLDNLFETQGYNGGTEPLLDNRGNQVFAPDGVTRLNINKKGIYFFIEDYLANNIKDSKYKGVFDNINIAGEQIQYQLGGTKSGNVYNVELSASFVSNPSMSRKIDLKIPLPPKPVENYVGGTVSRGDYIQSPTNLNDNTFIHKNQKPKFIGNYIGGISFEEKKNKYGLSIPKSLLTNLTPATNIQNSPAYFNQITGSNKTTITIPKNKVVYANSLNWNGNNRTLIVEGTLIIDNFDIQGSSKVEIKNTGTIIANVFKFWSNSTEIIFPSVTDGGGSGSGGGTPKYTSDVDWVSNTYKIDDYQTER